MSWFKEILAIIFVFTLFAGIASAESSNDEYSNKGTKLIEELTLTGSRNAVDPERYVFYFKPLTDDKGLYSYMASAGHNISELFAKTEDAWIDIKHKILIYTEKVDLYIGVMVDFRKNMVYFTVNKYIEIPSVAYTVKEPVSVLKKPSAQVLERINQYELDNTRLELCQSDNLVLFRSEVPIQPGFSGAPVVSKDGNLLGILIGACNLDLRIYHVTPISTALKVFNRYLK